MSLISLFQFGGHHLQVSNPDVHPILREQTEIVIHNETLHQPIRIILFHWFEPAKQFQTSAHVNHCKSYWRSIHLGRLNNAVDWQRVVQKRGNMSRARILQMQKDCVAIIKIISLSLCRGFGKYDSCKKWWAIDIMSRGFQSLTSIARRIPIPPSM